MSFKDTSKKIEDTLKQERDSLAETLGNLQDRVSIDGLAQEALGMLRENAGQYTHTIDRAVRSNPMALALTGAGLAWLILGNRSGGETPDPKETTVDRWEGEGGPARPADAYDDFDHAGTPRSDDVSWADRLDALRTRATSKIAQIEREAKTHARNVAEGIADKVDAARDFAAERASVASDFTAEMRTTLSHGLEGLTEDAQTRVIAAREKAYGAALRGRTAAKQGVRKTGNFIEENPLVAGLIAAAVGAAVASVLPRTKVEDRAFGNERDRLMHEAQKMLQQERVRAKRVVAGVAEELKDGAKDAVSAARKKAEEAGDAAVKRAKSEA